MRASSRTSAFWRLRLLLAVAVLTIAGSVWLVSQAQRDAADRAYQESAAGQRMLVAMLNQETGFRGFALTRREEFLAPFKNGIRDFEQALRDAGTLAGDERKARDLSLQADTARDWRAMARTEIARLRADRFRSFQTGPALMRKQVFDRFRVQNASLQRDLTAERTRKLDRAGLLSVAVILLVAFFFFGVSYFLIDRQAKAARRRREREREYKRSQNEFAETMQVMRDEDEAHNLVKNHLERAVDGARVVVLNRNASSDRLEATTALSEDSPLSKTLIDAEPASCLAVRLATPYSQKAGDRPLLACSLCGASETDVTCVPSLVSGEVIGSVNVQLSNPPSHEERERVAVSVTQAAPVLANLRNLALAEARAATDALTGLPNKRACGDTLKRMVAHAGRSVSPLSALLLDLDHFKQINDTFGHGIGDDALAAVGEVISANLRTSDFAGRYGGEEFLVLLPDTDREGAAQAAEKLRATIARMEVAGLERQITASLGLACYPMDAGDADTLVRMADRALYAAKNGGRNRVEVAVGARDGEPGDADSWALKHSIENPARLEALENSGLLDTPPEERFDRVTRELAGALHAPGALVSLVDADRQFFKSRIDAKFDPDGKNADDRETPLAYSFCKHVVGGGEPLVVEDAQLNAVVRGNPAIESAGVRAYLGVPLRTQSGQVLGSLCVFDREPREWSDEDLQRAQQAARDVMLEISPGSPSRA